MRIRSALLVTFVLSIAGTVRAEPPAPSGDAQREAATRFDRGVKLFDAQDYSAALAEFEAANRRAPRYQMLFNIGVTDKRLFRYNDAVRALRRYLDEGGDKVPPDRRDQVERELQEIRALVAEVMVRVSGLPASIEVDGRLLGETPLGAPLYLASGHHTVRASRQGDDPASKDIDVVSGEKLEVALEPRPRLTSALVTLASHPAGAELSLDGKKLGTAPWSGSVEPGGHRVEARLPGHKKSQTELMVTVGQARALTVELEPLPIPVKWYRRWYVWTVPLVLIAGAVVAGVEGYDATHQRAFYPVEWNP